MFAARALASRLTAPLVVLEGGAGVGVVLRTLLEDPALAARVDRIAAYHYTDLDPALLAVGKAGLAHVAPDRWRERSCTGRSTSTRSRAIPRRRASSRGPSTPSCSSTCSTTSRICTGRSSRFRRLLRPGGALIFTGAFRGPAATFFPCEMLQLTLAS